MNHVQPAALRDDWSLRLGPSLMTPKHTYKGYLSGIFIGALANGIPWVRTWAGQIMSALAWLQAALLPGYGRGKYAGYAQGICGRTPLFAGDSESSVLHFPLDARQKVHSRTTRTTVPSEMGTLGGGQVHVMVPRWMRSTAYI